jgi:acyl-CoA synthetase (AMP-forming)/AMP-acid ligase II
MASILSDFATSVARYPDRVAIIDGRGKQTTFAQLKSRADCFAQQWQTQGIGRGDRVLLAMPVGADLYASLAALWTLGATVVLPEPAMGVQGLRHAIKTTQPKGFCSAGAYGLLKYALPALWRATHLRPKETTHAAPAVLPPEDDDIALISFTSGTTGAPKAIPRSHAFLTAQHHAVAPLLHSPDTERDLVAFPVFVLINIASGQTSVLPNWKMSAISSLAPKKLSAWITEQGVTRALIPPAICEKITQEVQPDSLHTVFTGGGPVFPDLVDRLCDAGLTVTCVYGSTEAEPIAHLHADQTSVEDRLDMLAGKGLLVGYPVPGLKLRIVDSEIQVAGAHVNAGYLDPCDDAENKVHEDGTIWHRTGDAGLFDDTGRLWLLGRAGSQVHMPQRAYFPFSVEVAVNGWEGVRHCAFINGPQGATLVIDGDAQHLGKWTVKAKELGIERVDHIEKMPMDKRHGSKIDRVALGKA